MEVESGVEALEDNVDANMGTMTEEDKKSGKGTPVHTSVPNIPLIPSLPIVNIDTKSSTDLKYVPPQKTYFFTFTTYFFTIIVFVNVLLLRESQIWKGFLLGLWCFYILNILHTYILDNFFGDEPNTELPKLRKNTVEKNVSYIIPTVKEHTPLKKFECWVNHYRYREYDPVTYNINRTATAFMKLEGCNLRISYTRQKISKRSLWNEKIENPSFYQHRLYNLTGAKVALLPEGLVQRRLWSKKYPVCVVLSDKEPVQVLERETGYDKRFSESLINEKKFKDGSSQHDVDSTTTPEKKRKFVWRKREKSMSRTSEGEASREGLRQRLARKMHKDKKIENVLFDEMQENESVQSDEIFHEAVSDLAKVILSSKDDDEDIFDDNDTELSKLLEEADAETDPGDGEWTVHSKSCSGLKLFLFGRTGRDKFELFRRLAIAINEANSEPPSEEKTASDSAADNRENSSSTVYKLSDKDTVSFAKALIKYLAEAHRGAHGFVMDDQGNPVERASVRVKGRDVAYHTTKYGEFWRILLPGTYWLEVSARDYLPTEVEFIVIDSHPTLLNVTLHSTKAGATKPTRQPDFEHKTAPPTIPPALTEQDSHTKAFLKDGPPSAAPDHEYNADAAIALLNLDRGKYTRGSRRPLNNENCLLYQNVSVAAAHTAGPAMALEEAEDWAGNWSAAWGNGSYGAYNASESCGPLALPAVSLVTQALYALVCVVGLLGNSLVIYVVLRYSKMQTVTNMYIVNLAIADECFLIGIPFLIATMALRSWPFGSFMCKAYMISTGINQFTSSIFLCIMSADRYVAVCHPIAAPRLRTPLVSRVVAAAAWTASALVMTPIFMYTTLIRSEHGLSCNIVWPESEASKGQASFTLYSFALGFAAPLTLIFIFYCLVIRKLKTVGPKNKSKEKKRSHRKVTKLVLTVITVYVLCWLPYWAFQVALIYQPPAECASRVTVAVFLVAACFSYSNSAMNPILYAFLSDNFKKSFLKACTCAAGKDVNAALHVENSVIPRRRGGPRAHRASPAALAAPQPERSDASTALTSRSLAASEAMPLQPLVPLNGAPHTQL